MTLFKPPCKGITGRFGPSTIWLYLYGGRVSKHLSASVQDVTLMSAPAAYQPLQCISYSLPFIFLIDIWVGFDATRSTKPKHLSTLCPVISPLVPTQHAVISMRQRALLHARETSSHRCLRLQGWNDKGEITGSRK